MRKTSLAAAAYRSSASSDSYAVTPAIGPLPATYLSAPASDSRLRNVWRTVSGLVHVLGSHQGRPRSRRLQTDDPPRDGPKDPNPAPESGTRSRTPREKR